jgi:ABC-type microcin C transport system permease subunit YejB
MALLTKRRAFLALPLLAACANEQPAGPFVPPGPPSYGHLTPLRLKVGTLEIQEAGSGTAFLVDQAAPLQPADVMLRMARDRLSTAGGPGKARFLIQTASLTREGGTSGGVFSPASETFRCVMRCQVEIISSEDAILASATAEALDRVRRELGLDRPFLVRMGEWYLRLLQGDLGTSLLLNRSVTEAILERLPITLSLTAMAFVLAVLLGVAAGVLAAMRHGRAADQGLMSLALLGLSLPEFWLGLVLI